MVQALVDQFMLSKIYSWFNSKRATCKTVRQIAILICSQAITACVEGIGVEVPSENQFLVVDGFITNELGPHTIRLSTSAFFKGPLDGGTNRPVDDAELMIHLSSGVEVSVENFGHGIYITPEWFRAETGIGYQLEIVWNERHYISSEERLADPIILDSIYYEYLDKEFLSGTGNVSRKFGLQFYADFTYPENKVFAKFDWDGTFIFTTPSRENGLRLDCYTKEVASEFFNMTNNIELISKQVKKHEVFFEQLDFRYRFQYNKGIKIYTLNKGVEGFFSQIELQLDNTGSIFDPTPVRIEGNISNNNTKEEVVLGYFGVFHVSEKRIHIRNNELPSPESMYTQGPYRTCANLSEPGLVPPDFCDNCILYPGSSYTPPDFW